MSAARFIDMARAKGLMVATAESCTGGLVAGAITEVPGSSDVFERGFVTYSNAAKVEMLGVDSALIDTHGAVSEEVALAMVTGAAARSAATIAVSITGVAGPGGSDHKPEGMVCFGIATKAPDGQITAEAETVQFGALGRSKVRKASVDHALDMLIMALY